ncbi:DUF4397 domain-containing protein [Lapillicoccus jejuensis]|uniref:Uncharacterized protein DUF4397 n=1 Tax=Lapillicoccus jejuensis TaxID=402171 RepID=A0A542E022_9MICO|nr:DUF4397 domain-containing protein [Lapillicoccus jejuensis]TQJ08683.1 uncharacterized protein DUF4397 [Lapillicoccus jejuensis]
MTRTTTSTRHAARGARRAGLLGALLTAVAVLVATLGLATAGSAAADDTAGATPPGAAWIRAGHFVPGFGAARVDLLPEGSSAGAPSSVVMSPGATYGDMTSYQKIAPGSYTVQIRSSGAQPSTAPLLTRSFSVTAGSAHTVAVVGNASAPRLVVLGDDLTPPAAGSARVRLLDASASATSLDVAAQNGPTLASGAVLGQVTPYATVPKGPWTLTLGGSGATPATQRISLESGNVYTAIALDSDGGLRVQLVTDAAGSAALPAGGAATGLGGLAAGAGTTAPSPLVAPAAVAALAVLAAFGAVVARRRPGRVR